MGIVQQQIGRKEPCAAHDAVGQRWGWRFMPRLLGSGIASQSGDYLIRAGKETGAGGEEFPKTQRAGIRTCVEGNVPLQSDPDAD